MIDSGTYLSSKRRFYSFLIVPAALLVVFYVFIFGYIKVEKDSIAKRNEFLKIMPLMAGQLDKARAIIGRFQSPADESNTIKTVNDQLSLIADKSGLKITSLAVESRAAKKDSSNFIPFSVTLNASGPVDSIEKFFDNLYNLERLFIPESVSLGMSGNKSNSYDMGASLIYYRLDKADID